MSRRGAWGRRPRCWPGRQLTAVGGEAPHNRAEAPDYAGRRRLELRFAERGRAAVLPSSRHLYGRLYGRGCRSRGYGFFCFSVATAGTLEAWSRECDENDGLNGFGKKSLRHTQFPIVRGPSEPTSPALVRRASA